MRPASTRVVNVVVSTVASAGVEGVAEVSEGGREGGEEEKRCECD